MKLTWRWMWPSPCFQRSVSSGGGGGGADFSDSGWVWRREERECGWVNKTTVYNSKFLECTRLKLLAEGWWLLNCLAWFRRWAAGVWSWYYPHPAISQWHGWQWKPWFQLFDNTSSSYTSSQHFNQLHTLLSDLGQQFRAKPLSEIFSF